MDGSVPDLPGQLAGLLDGTVNLVQFQHWIGLNSLAIELHGTDDDLELLNVVEVRFAEYTSDYINLAEPLHALQTDPLVRSELATSASIGYGMEITPFSNNHLGSGFPLPPMLSSGLR